MHIIYSIYIYTVYISYIPWFNERKLAKHLGKLPSMLSTVPAPERPGDALAIEASEMHFINLQNSIFTTRSSTFTEAPFCPTKNPSNGSTRDSSPVVPHGDTCESPRRVWNLQFTKFWPRAVDENQPVTLTCWCCFSKWAQLKTSAQQPACWELLAEFTKRKITWEKKCRKITSKFQWCAIFPPSYQYS